ncbi:hypothetical protein D3C86_1442820 [compost metagenome]
MTDDRPRLSKAELAHALHELKGVSVDLDSQSGYDTSVALIEEIMADPTQRDRLVTLLEQFEDHKSERSANAWVNDGSPFDRAAAPPVSDDLYLDLPMGAEESCLLSGFAGATVKKFLSKYKEEMISSVSFGTCMSPKSQYVLDDSVGECYPCNQFASFDVDAWRRVLLLAQQQLPDEAFRRASFVSRLAQVFHREDVPEWEVEKCPINRDSFLVVLNHGDDHASIGFVGNGQRAFVMVSINDTALTMNESFQDTQKFAARIADFFIDAPKSGHKAIQHMLRAL